MRVSVGYQKKNRKKKKITKNTTRKIQKSNQAQIDEFTMSQKIFQSIIAARFQFANEKKPQGTQGGRGRYAKHTGIETGTDHTHTNKDTLLPILCDKYVKESARTADCKWIGLKKVVCKTQTSRPPFPPQLTAIKIAAATRQQQQQQLLLPSMGRKKESKRERKQNY